MSSAFIGSDMSQRSLDKLSDRPNVVGCSDCNCWRSSQRFVCSAEIVVCDVQRDGSAVIFQPLAGMTAGNIAVNPLYCALRSWPRAYPLGCDPGSPLLAQ